MPEPRAGAKPLASHRTGAPYKGTADRAVNPIKITNIVALLLLAVLAH